MIQRSFEDIIEGWGQGQYTVQELITHLIKHAEESKANLLHNQRLLETMEKRLTELEEEVK